jgi:hypothetical protein
MSKQANTDPLLMAAVIALIYPYYFYFQHRHDDTTKTRAAYVFRQGTRRARVLFLRAYGF